MNRSFLQQSSPVQQMMAGNPNNWWNINTTMRPPAPQQPSPFFSTPPSSFLTPYSPASSLPLPSWHDNQELPAESWSHLLMSGLVSEEDKANIMLSEPLNVPLVDVKQESSANSYVYGHGNEEFQAAAKPTWTQIVPASSSSNSCASNFSSSMLDFSNNRMKKMFERRKKRKQIPNYVKLLIYTNYFVLSRKEKHNSLYKFTLRSLSSPEATNDILLGEISGLYCNLNGFTCLANKLEDSHFPPHKQLIKYDPQIMR